MWEVDCLFDHDDYYQAGRSIDVNGRFSYEHIGRKFRDKNQAQTYVDKLNKEMLCKQP
jgi:hypothetical protein